MRCCHNDSQQRNFCFAGEGNTQFAHLVSDLQSSGGSFLLIFAAVVDDVL
jgi:hypothetical protein